MKDDEKSRQWSGRVHEQQHSLGLPKKAKLSRQSQSIGSIRMFDISQPRGFKSLNVCVAIRRLLLLPTYEYFTSIT